MATSSEEPRSRSGALIALSLVLCAGSAMALYMAWRSGSTVVVLAAGGGLALGAIIAGALTLFLSIRRGGGVGRRVLAVLAIVAGGVVLSCSIGTHGRMKAIDGCRSNLLEVLRAVHAYPEEAGPMPPLVQLLGPEKCRCPGDHRPRGQTANRDDGSSYEYVGPQAGITGPQIIAYEKSPDFHGGGRFVLFWNSPPVFVPEGRFQALMAMRDRDKAQEDLMLKVWALVRAGDGASATQALDLLEKNQAQLRERPNFLLVRGIALMRLDRPADALPCFDAAMKVPPERPEAVKWAAFACRALRQMERGAELSLRAARMGVVEPDCMAAAALALIGKPKVALLEALEASRYAEKALESPQCLREGDAMRILERLHAMRQGLSAHLDEILQPFGDDLSKLPDVMTRVDLATLQRVFEAKEIAAVLSELVPTDQRIRRTYLACGKALGLDRCYASPGRLSNVWRTCEVTGNLPRPPFDVAWKHDFSGKIADINAVSVYCWAERNLVLLMAEDELVRAMDLASGKPVPDVPAADLQTLASERGRWREIRMRLFPAVPPEATLDVLRGVFFKHEGGVLGSVKVGDTVVRYSFHARSVLPDEPIWYAESSYTYDKQYPGCALGLALYPVHAYSPDVTAYRADDILTGRSLWCTRDGALTQGWLGPARDRVLAIVGVRALVRTGTCISLIHLSGGELPWTTDSSAWQIGEVLAAGVGGERVVLVGEKGAVALKAQRPSGAVVPADSSLMNLVRERADYRVYVGIPLADPTEWVLATRSTDAGLELPDGSTAAYGAVRAAVVCYPNGQAVQAWPGPLPLPAGVGGLRRSLTRRDATIRLEDLDAGHQHVRVTFGPSLSRPNAPDHYSTTLTNISAKNIRVDAFGGYSRTGDTYRLNTVTGEFFTAKEFRNWYGLGESEWILPGQSVADRNNYGARPVIWAYQCTTESGEKVLVGALAE